MYGPSGGKDARPNGPPQPLRGSGRAVPRWRDCWREVRKRIYGVNTGVGGNIKFDLAGEEAETLQRNIMRHLSCATGSPLPAETVRAAMLLRPVATFATGCSGVRPLLCEALLRMLNAGVTPVVPRYGSVGASGDLMPSAYVARSADRDGKSGVRRSDNGRDRGAGGGAGLAPISFASKEGLALINGTTMMTAVAALLLPDAQAVLRGLLKAIALSVEALEVPTEPYDAFVHEKKGHPGQIAVADYVRAQLKGSGSFQWMRRSRVAIRFDVGRKGLGLRTKRSNRRAPLWSGRSIRRTIIRS